MKSTKRLFSVIILILLIHSMAGSALAATTENTQISDSQTYVTTSVNVKASSLSYCKIKVSWDSVSGLDGYQVYRSSSKNGTFVKTFTTTDPKKNWYVDEKRTSGKIYYYKVRGFKKIGSKIYYTKYSPVVSTYARPNKVTVTSLTTSGDALLNFNLKWNAVDGATGYQVYMKERNASSYNLVGSYTKTSAKFDIPNTVKLYDIKVRAYRVVNGKKIYGFFSNVANYKFEWTADMLKKAGEDYLLKTYPGIILEDSYNDGSKKTPDDSSWSALWPGRFCYYLSWESAKAELEEKIYVEMLVNDNELNYVCMYLDAESASTNWVHIYMLS